MISKASLVRALLVVEKDKHATLPFACVATPGWLWAGAWGARSNRMTPVRTSSEADASAAAFLKAAVALLDDPKNRLVLRNGPRESSDGALSLYVLARPHGDPRCLVGVDARLWPLLDGLELWGAGPRAMVAGFKQGGVEALVMPRVLSEEDKDLTPIAPLAERVRAACRAATDALVTRFDPLKTREMLAAMDAAGDLVERKALEIARTPGLVSEVRTIIGACQEPAHVADPARYAELMKKRSSRAGYFHSKLSGHLDRAEAVERRRAARERLRGKR